MVLCEGNIESDGYFHDHRYPGLPHGGASLILPGVRVWEQWQVDYPKGLKWLLAGAPLGATS